MSFSLPILNRRVVVTGIGAVTPLGNTFKETWKNLTSKTGFSSEYYGITTVEEAIHCQNLPSDELDYDMKLIQVLPSQVAAPVRNVICEPRTSRFVQFALNATKEALEDAGLKDWLRYDIEESEVDQVTQERRTRCGSSVASGMSSVRDVYTNHRICVERGSIRRMNPLFVPQIIPNGAASRTSIAYKLRGPSLAPCTACAAGAHAIGEAMRYIQLGDADIMVAGGAESAIDPISMAGFCRLKALSTKFNDDPLRSSRPFDKDRCGFVMGEGAAILILEEMEHAISRGANILCELKGYGASADGYHVTSPDPEGLGAERAMRMALQRAQLEPSSVDYVNAHATSTPLGDEIESKTINRVLNDRNRTSDLFVSSTKGSTGHLLGAAGAIESAFTVQSIVENIIPQTVNLHIPDGNENQTNFFKHVIGSPLENITVKIAVNNSFGFGGTNACLVFTSHER
jgi:3-oxoacyl-[acyl-carrier-protein] synthase II